MAKDKSLQNPIDKLLEGLVKNHFRELVIVSGFLFSLGVLVLGSAYWQRQNKEQIVLETANSPTEEVLSESITAIPMLNLVVDISGAVSSPGVYSLEEGSRVKDVIGQAGGFSEEANLEYVSKYINLAQILFDGDKIYIPKKGEQLSAPVSQPLGKINLNTATQAELETLSGIGPTYAQRIIKARPFKSIEEIMKVSGIGTKLFSRIKDKITI